MTVSDGLDRGDANVVFTPSGRRGAVPLGMTVLDAARRLGVDLDSVCNGRALCGRCMVTPAFGDVRQARDHERSRPPRRPEPRTSARTAAGARSRRRAARVLGAHPGRRAGRRARGEPGAPTRRAQDRRARRSRRSIRSCASTSSTSPAPDLGADRSDLRRLFDALAEQWGLADLAMRPAVARGAATGAGGRRAHGDGRGARRSLGLRGVARLRRHRLRHGGRRRLDDRRRASLRPRDRRGASRRPGS